MKIAKTMLPERLAINKKNRDYTFEYLEMVGVTYIRSTSNFFMMSVREWRGAESGRPC